MTVVNNRGRYFMFSNKESLLRFIQLYGDLFTPYSDTYIQSDCRGRLGDPLDYDRLKKGYMINPFGDNELLIKVNLTNESKNTILESNCFTKSVFLTSRRSYRLEVYVIKENSGE